MLLMACIASAQTPVSFSISKTAESIYNNLSTQSMGYNSEDAFDHMKIKNCNTGYYNTSSYNCMTNNVCLSNVPINGFSDLPGNILKFPGGNQGNIFHSGITDLTSALNNCPTMYNGFNNTNNKFQGYGTKNSSGTNSEKRLPGANLNNMFNQEYVQDTSQKRSFIYDIVDFAETSISNNNKDVNGMYVINLLTHFFDTNGDLVLDINGLTDLQLEDKITENLNSIKFMILNGIDIKGIELGNELNLGGYSTNYVNWQFNTSSKSYAMTVGKYIFLCQKYIDRIKADPLLSDIPIGVIANIDYGAEQNCDVTKVSGAYGSNGGYNYYACWNKALKDALSTGALNFDAYILHKYHPCTNLSLEIDTIAQYFINQIEIFSTQYNNVSGKNKKIWLTEWNNLDENSNACNDIYNSSFITELNSKILSYNAFNNDKIQFSIFHNFVGGGELAIIKKANGILNLSPSFYTHKILNILLNENVRSVNDNIVNTTGLTQKTFRVRHFINDNYLYLLYYNLGTSSVNLSGTFNNLEITQNVPGTYLKQGSCSDNTLSADINYVDFNNPVAVLNSNINLNSAAINIPGKSVGVLKIELYNSCSVPTTTQNTPSEFMDLNVIPNPSNGLYSVRIPAGFQNSENHIRVFNTLGEIIYESNISNKTDYTINISHQPKGNYIIQVSNKENILTKKITLQ